MFKKLRTRQKKRIIFLSKKPYIFAKSFILDAGLDSEYVSSGLLYTFTLLTLFFPMFRFYLPEYVRKQGFLTFSGGSKENIGNKRLKAILCPRK